VVRYDVAVSGLGPAGASFVRRISGAGLKVIAFDSARFPREKPCAGGLTPKAFRLARVLFPGVENLVKSKVNAIVLRNEELEAEVKAGKVLTYTVDRKEFDAFLLDSLLRDGKAEVHLEEAVLTAESDGKLWRIKTSKGTYTARVLISADGVNSRLARQFGVKREMGFTLSADVPVKSEKMLIDTTNFSWGYFWMFPKEGATSVGIGEFTEPGKNLAGRAKDFARKYRLPDAGFRGYPIPAGKRRCDVSRDRLLFLGDAGGLVDPLTGEGIYYAMRSGVLAGTAVERAFETGDFKHLKGYERAVNEEFGREFFWARLVGKLFFRAKNLALKVVERNEEVGRITALLLSGDISYSRSAVEFLKLLIKTHARL
jgi:geranylgeranyl reductase family protein